MVQKEKGTEMLKNREFQFVQIKKKLLSLFIPISEQPKQILRT